MKNLILILMVFSLLVFTVSAQQKTRISDKNPLDCAFDLIKSEEDLEKWDDELSQIANLYWKSGQRNKAFEAADRITDSKQKAVTFLSFAKEYEKEKNTQKNVEIYLKVYEILRNDDGFDNIWKNETEYGIVKTLTTFGYSVKMIDEIAGNSDKEDKSFALLAVADGFTENKEFEKALNLIPQIVENAELSKWKDLELFAKAKAGTIYLKAGKIKEAKVFYDEVLKASAALKEIEHIFVDDLWLEVFEGYKSVSRFEDAIKVLQAYKEINTLNSERFSFPNLIETYLQNNQKDKAITLLNENFASEGADDDWIAEKFLEIDDEQATKNIFYSTKNEYDQQLIARRLADYYQRKGKIELSVDILNQAFEKAQKIKSDEPESGMMSTSPAREKADYMSKIAEKFIAIKRYDSALSVISVIEKPRIKAQTLVKLAVGQNSKNSLNLINQAYLLVKNKKESFLDANKYEVLNQIALGYSQIGQKNKSVQIFDEILNMKHFTDVDSMGRYSLQILAEAGFYYNESKIGDNPKITNSLQQIIKNWKNKDE